MIIRMIPARCARRVSVSVLLLNWKLIIPGRAAFDCRPPAGAAEERPKKTVIKQLDCLVISGKEWFVFMGFLSLVLRGGLQRETDYIGARERS